MNIADKVQETIVRIDVLRSNNLFDPQDCRYGFYSKLLTIMNFYFFCLINVDLAIEAKRGTVKLIGNISYRQLRIISNWVSLSESKRQEAYYASMNRNLLMEPWLVLEISLSSILNDLLRENHSPFSYTVADSEVGRLRSSLRSGNMPISKMIRLCFDIAGEHYCGNAEADQQFLKMFASIRNSAHLNFVRPRTEQVFYFRSYTYVLKTGSLPIAEPDGFLPIMLLDMVFELALIFTDLSASLNCSLVVPDVAENLIQSSRNGHRLDGSVG